MHQIRCGRSIFPGSIRKRLENDHSFRGRNYNGQTCCELLHNFYISFPLVALQFSRNFACSFFCCCLIDTIHIMIVRFVNRKSVDCVLLLSKNFHWIVLPFCYSPHSISSWTNVNGAYHKPTAHEEFTSVCICMYVWLLVILTQRYCTDCQLCHAIFLLKCHQLRFMFTQQSTCVTVPDR